MQQPLIHTEVTKYFCEMFKEELDSLYYGDIYILELTQEGEEFYEWLINEQWIFKYGAYIYLKKYKEEYYNIILVNND